MFSKKSSLKALNNIIEYLRNGIDNKEVLDYILPNLALATTKGATINFKGKNSVIIISGFKEASFYLEVTPSFEAMDRIYARATKDNGNFDERFTADFDKGLVSIHKFSSSISKDWETDTIDSINDEFMDETFENGDLRFRRMVSTSIAYPSFMNALTSSDLEEIAIGEDGTGVLKKFSISSEQGETHSYGLFDSKVNGIPKSGKSDELKEVRLISEEEYDDFVDKINPKYTKKLK